MTGVQTCALPISAIDSAALAWDGPDVKFSDVKGRVDADGISGTLTVDLAGRAPKYHTDGRYQKVAFKGGKLDVTGTADAAGAGGALLGSLQAQGTFEGKAIAFSSDAIFRTVTGKFDARASGVGLQWKLSSLEGMIGADAYKGDGSSEADGKVVLHLTSGDKPATFSGSILAAQ